MQRGGARLVAAHKTTEQNPKSASGLAELINFFFDTYFPRMTPSTSIPTVDKHEDDVLSTVEIVILVQQSGPASDLDFVIVLEQLFQVLVGDLFSSRHYV